jgi:hypothetical protein
MPQYSTLFFHPLNTLLCVSASVFHHINQCTCVLARSEDAFGQYLMMHGIDIGKLVSPQQMRKD